MQMRELPRGGQFSIKGNVVNVPVDVMPTITALPRNLSETQTVPIKLKKRMMFQSSVYTENVRPLKVLSAIKWLLSNGPLYKELNIQLNETWLENVSNASSESEPMAEFIENHCSDHTSTESTSDEFSEVDDNERRSANMDTMLTDAEYDSSQILTFAPGENQRPLSLLQDADAEYLAFPTIFCGKRRADNSERQVPISYSDICKFELRSVDRRVAASVPNLFFKLKKIEMHQIRDKVSLALRRCKMKGQKLTAREVLDEEKRDRLVKLDEGYHIFRTIRNSPPYLEKRKKDLMAMIRQLGFPTYFVSLSAADTRWTDLLGILGKLVDNRQYTENELKEMNWADKTRLIQADPVTCVRFFDNRLQHFISGVLNSELLPIGQVEDSFVRIEFQQRGSPHAHIMFWIKDAPTYDKSSPQEIVDFIDKYISCSSDVDEESKPMLQMQIHKHSKTCRKGTKPICRFGFPKPPMSKTMLLHPLESDDTNSTDSTEKLDYERLMTLISSHKDGIMSFTQLLLKLNLDESQYIRCIQSSINSPTIFLKRDPCDIRVNPYMKNLLSIYGANHDIQYVLDPYACAVYIVAYMSKSQRGMSILMDKACKEARQNTTDLRKQVRVIGSKFINGVEVSAQEAAYLLLQLPITRASRGVVFINTSPKQDRTFLLKSKKLLEEMDPETTDIESGNIVKRYSRRPKVLEKWCLADYVSKLTVEFPEKDNDPYDSDYEDDPTIDLDNTEEYLSPLTDNIDITLRSGVRIRTCKVQKVIRFVNFNKTTEQENYCRERLMLYLPWRKEPQDIPGPHESYAIHFDRKHNIINPKIAQYEKNYRISLELLQQVSLDNILASAEIASLVPNTEQTEADDALEGPSDSTQYAFYKPSQSNHTRYDIAADIGATASTAQPSEMLAHRMSDENFYVLLSHLNVRQREFYTHVMQNITRDSEPLHVFLTGGAGVGKSMVIKTLYQALHRHLNSQEGEDPEDIRLLLCAPTGKAAYNIEGITTHSAFQIDPNQGFNYKKLSSNRLNTLRVKYRHLSVVIIDEISMVGNKQFLFIHQRLQEIKQSALPFGGVHMIVVGDLFQLKPVKDQWIFQDVKSAYGPLALNLWEEYFHIHELTQIMRQQNDQPFAELLNRLREGEQTESDILELEKCCVDGTESDYCSFMTHLFPTNALVNEHNAKIFSSANTEKAVIGAQDTVVGDLPLNVKEQLKKKGATRC
ncbi:ATP-dependent DNA helicase PIF1 [Holothuria leucospilota]|uniref:ATP-dependent DNA helicase n=1 Tax=Holothuria leucospilota TaxID=206669 RepID=A0A9Q1CN08_HOLLE|nr:ATP-dependent DNA helicase PIF1 [Holothuria leucospilota]